MEIFEAIRTVLAVRQYKTTPVTDEIIREVVEAGRLTGSAKNAQPWHFIVVRDRSNLERLGGASPSGPYIAQAAFAIAVAAEKGSFGLSDGSRAIQSMALAAWSHGIGSNWAGFASMPAVSELLGVPDAYDVIGVMPFGYPEKKIGFGKKKRKPLGEVASSERYGQPFA